MNKKKGTIKINIKQLIIVLLIFANTIFFISIFGRYVKDNVESFFSRSKEFYFYSDKLGDNNPQYQIESWSGVDDYTITVKVNSYKNNLLKTPYQILYDISYTSSDNIICQLSKEHGTIGTETNTDFFNLVITPNTILETGDSVYVDITVQASEPYEKTLTGRFTLVVGQEQLTYEIDDEQNRPYMEVNITNTLSYYNISEAFDSYSTEDKITRAVYLSLTPEKQAKCYSSIVTIAFNPNIILLDMTSEAYGNAVSVSETTIGGYTYINSISFKVDALSSKKVRFYKKDQTQDYTYPNNNNTPIVTLTSI